MASHSPETKVVSPRHVSVDEKSTAPSSSSRGDLSSHFDLSSGCDSPLNNNESVKYRDTSHPSGSKMKTGDLVVLPLKYGTLRLLDSLNRSSKNCCAIDSAIQGNEKLAQIYFRDNADDQTWYRVHSSDDEWFGENMSSSDGESSSDTTSCFSITVGSTNSVAYGRKMKHFEEEESRGVSMFCTSDSSITTNSSCSDCSISEASYSGPDERIMNLPLLGNNNNNNKNNKNKNKNIKNDFLKCKNSESCIHARDNTKNKNNKNNNMSRILSAPPISTPNGMLSFTNFDSDHSFPSEIYIKEYKYETDETSMTNSELTWETLDCLPVVECSPTEDESEANNILRVFQSVGFYFRKMADNILWPEPSGERQVESNFSSNLRPFSFLAPDDIMWHS